MERTIKRPLGVTGVALLQWLGGVFGMFSAVMLPGAVSSQALGILLGAILSIVLGIGLWQLKRWAWIATLILQSLSALTSMLGPLSGSVDGVVQMIVSLIIIYLLLPTTRSVFQRA